MSPLFRDATQVWWPQVDPTSWLHPDPCCEPLRSRQGHAPKRQAFHRILSAMFVFINIVGNCVATLVVAKWEKAIDTTALNAELHAGGDVRSGPGREPISTGT
jgi:hypothetical protein